MQDEIQDSLLQEKLYPVLDETQDFAGNAVSIVSKSAHKHAVNFIWRVLCTPLIAYTNLSYIQLASFPGFK